MRILRQDHTRSLLIQPTKRSNGKETALIVVVVVIRGSFANAKKQFILTVPPKAIE